MDSTTEPGDDTEWEADDVSESMPDLLEDDEPDDYVEWSEIHTLGVEFAWTFETAVPVANQPLIYALHPDFQQVQHTPAAASAA